MTSVISIARLSSSDLARLGNNLPRRRRRSRLIPPWHTEAIRRSLSVHEPDLADDLGHSMASAPELSDALA